MRHNHRRSAQKRLCAILVVPQSVKFYQQAPNGSVQSTAAKSGACASSRPMLPYQLVILSDRSRAAGVAGSAVALPAAHTAT